MRVAKALVGLHICTGSPEPSSLDNVITVPKSRAGICVSFMRAAKALASLHICAGSPEPSALVPKSHVLAQMHKMAISVSFMRAAKALASLHICAGWPEHKIEFLISHNKT